MAVCLLSGFRSVVCLNAKISVIITARDTKFGMIIPIYNTLLKLGSNCGSHALIMLSFYINFYNRCRLYARQSS